MGCYSSKEQLRPLENSRAEETPRTGAVEKVPERVILDTPESESSRQVLRSLLVNDNRDYLVDKFGKRFKVDNLRGKPVAFLFSAHAVPAARDFTRILLHVYSELRSQKKPFEVVFISNDETVENWQQSVDEMEWLALPFEDHATGDSLGLKFGVRNIPTLVLLDKEGNVATKDGIEVIQKLGSTAWPFSKESISSSSFSHKSTNGNMQ